MSRVLVTGGNGFVGTNLVEMLQARGDEVTCLVRKSPRLERLKSLGARLAYFDGLGDESAIREAVANQQVVYHVAGATAALSRQRFYEINEQGPHNIAQACAEQPEPPVLVCVSSLAACGPVSSSGEPVREGDTPRPVSVYGRSKLAGERAVRQTADRVPTSIVRPGIVLGPADVNGFAMFRPIKRFGVHVTPGSGRQKFSIIHVTDLCRLIILAAERGRRIAVEENDESRALGCYFGTNDEFPSWAELGKMVAKALDRRRVLIVPVARPCVWMVAAAVQGVSQVIRRPLYLNWDKAREITAGSWICSPEAAKTELGFTPEAPLAERLRQTAQWYRDAGWL